MVKKCSSNAQLEFRSERSSRLVVKHFILGVCGHSTIVYTHISEMHFCVCTIYIYLYIYIYLHTVVKT